VKLTVCLLLALNTSAYAQLTDVSADLKRSSECMFKVLKSVPGVTKPRLGWVRHNGIVLPFLEYDAAESSRWSGPTRFTIHSSPEDGMYFGAALPGVGPLDTHVTDAVIREWRVQCFVQATYTTG
jgi:hypothetical protein